MVRRSNTRPTLIYWLIDTRTNVPFYCGKTVRTPAQRFDGHKHDATSGERPVNRKIRECGSHVKMHVMETVPLGGDWVAREKRWIWLLRGINPDACNVSDGGTGVPGWVPSAETRSKISAANAARVMSDETRAKISAFMMGRVQPAESLARMRATLTGRNLSPEHCAKISKAKRGRPGKPHSAERRAKISAGNKGKKRSPETIARMSEGQKKAYLIRVSA